MISSARSSASSSQSVADAVGTGAPQARTGSGGENVGGGAIDWSQVYKDMQNNFEQAMAPRAGQTIIGGITGSQTMGTITNRDYSEQASAYRKANNISDKQWQMMQAANAFRRFSTGTPNTSKEGMRKIGGGFMSMLHDNEAVIPLPDGRSVPVTLKSRAIPGGGSSGGRGDGETKIVLNMNITTADAESFSRSKRQIEQDMLFSLRKVRDELGMPKSPDLTNVVKRNGGEF